MLIASFNEDNMTKEKAAKIIEYYSYRNYIAYKSHRKKRMLEMAKLTL